MCLNWETPSNNSIKVPITIKSKLVQDVLHKWKIISESPAWTRINRTKEETEENVYSSRILERGQNRPYIKNSLVWV